MFVILDTCSLGIGPSPDGGITLKVSDIEGLPNVQFAVPIGKQAAESLLEEAGTIMNKPKVFGLDDIPGGAPRA